MLRMMDEEDGVVNRRVRHKAVAKRKSEHRFLLPGESIDDLDS